MHCWDYQLWSLSSLYVQQVCAAAWTDTRYVVTRQSPQHHSTAVFSAAQAEAQGPPALLIQMTHGQAFETDACAEPGRLSAPCPPCGPQTELAPVQSLGGMNPHGIYTATRSAPMQSLASSHHHSPQPDGTQGWHLCRAWAAGGSRAPGAWARRASAAPRAARMREAHQAAGGRVSSLHACAEVSQKGVVMQMHLLFTEERHELLQSRDFRSWQVLLRCWQHTCAVRHPSDDCARPGCADAAGLVVRPAVWPGSDCQATGTGWHLADQGRLQPGFRPKLSPPQCQPQQALAEVQQGFLTALMLLWLALAGWAACLPGHPALPSPTPDPVVHKQRALYSP